MGLIKKKLRIIFTTPAMVIYLFACGGSCLKTNEIRDALYASLVVGDTREKIETALNDNDIRFSYSKYLNRYQATVRDEERCGPYQAISIYISLDKSEKLSKIEVFESYTMP